MNIIFNRVIGHNFLSISDCDLSLSNNGYVIVDGKNNYIPDLAKSNGSGKSSIFEMLVWALTGETVRGIKSTNIVNINGLDGTFVDLYTTINGEKWRLLRSKDHKDYKTNFRIWKNGEELSGKGIKDSERIFREYFPDLTLSLIGSVMILGQGLPQRFSNNTPSGRKEVLEKLSKSDFMIDDLKVRVRSRLDQLVVEIRKVEDEALKINTEIRLQKDRLNDSKRSLESMESVSILKETLDSKKKNLDKLNKELEELNISLESEKVAFSEAQNSLSSIQSKLNTELASISSLEASGSLQINERFNDVITNLSSKSASEVSQMSSVKREIKRLSAITDTCPTCGQKLIGVEKPDTSALEKELEDLIVTNNDTQEELRKVRASKDNELRALKDKYTAKKNEIETLFKNQIREATSNTVNKKFNINKLSTDISSKNKEIETTNTDINQLMLSIERHDTQVSYYTNVIDMASKDIDRLSTDLMYILNNKDNLLNRHAIVSKFNTSLTRDFRGILLSSLIEYINDRAKQYSQLIFDTTNINFELDGNNISISYNNKQYESLSGGEKQKVDLIVQFSIRDMLCKYLNFSCNIIVLDEIFDNLDSIGCDRVINLISTQLSDINSIYIVTHHEDLEIPSDIKWIITKSELGVSTVDAIL